MDSLSSRQVYIRCTERTQREIQAPAKDAESTNQQLSDIGKNEAASKAVSVPVSIRIERTFLFETRDESVRFESLERKHAKIQLLFFSPLLKKLSEMSLKVSWHSMRCKVVTVLLVATSVVSIWTIRHPEEIVSIENNGTLGLCFKCAMISSQPT